MKILAFDTANNIATVAISEGQKILAYIEELRPSMQAERLINMIESALEYSKLGYRDIDYLGVTNGPGSFTGIRIGLAAAKGILFNSKIKSTAISNFEVANFRATLQAKNYQQSIILLDAYRSQLYVQIFDNHNNSSSNPLLLDYEAVINLLHQQQIRTICAGSGIVRIYSKIKHLSYITILPRFSRVKSIYLCRYIDLTLNKRKLLPFEPLYIRGADAKLQNR
ncbi:tRNA (adenosine(37)-N6)-threonylcarbamoyltransferase complex dimerization subunit type 1 TsaB [Candidatus Trichorickettsia mobilis]|uniref:tRNA (adenosine(37)-N6)-threonylcarbamoyltransferase complex dimerization subunit type 1 TsaB n=1 Tax=Candidatus Trichorickettsia mobilis TaxID=1346319 RepID=UPI00292E58DC|nr:tRNA (adenosine(37)-N6)-threonylcarbamoyltransferase complex dimerization subunit type 1 TsaB [Candidatus Trichorickettsia mobilis]